MSALTEGAGRVAAGAENNHWADHLENWWEHKVVFKSRWLLAPAYGVLVLALAALAVRAIIEFARLVSLVPQWLVIDEADVVLNVLEIVDIVLVMNLVLMVLFVGYANFVSKIDFKQSKKSIDTPQWLGTLNYAGLKIQLIGSIIAITGILLLKQFVTIMISTNKIDFERTILLIGIHATFLFSGLILAIINWLSHGKNESIVPPATTENQRAG